MEKTWNVRELLPHRPPMLMVDRVLTLDEQRCTAVKCISQAEPAFQGHFPGNPVFPGVLIIEALAQTATILLTQAVPGKTPLFAGAEYIRFRRMVVPGDELRLEARLLGERKGFYSFETTASVGESAACTAEVTITLR